MDIYLHDTFWQDTFVWYVAIMLLTGIVYVIILILFKIQNGQTRASHRRSEIAWSEMGIQNVRRYDVRARWERGAISTQERDAELETINHAYNEAETEWLRAGNPDLDMKEKR